MGWKAFKEAFGIRHFVQVTDAGVCIGSGFCSDIVVIDPVTGAMRESPAFSGFLSAHYRDLLDASPEAIVSVLSEPDTFSASIPVFTFENGEIIEKQCEAPGWPNVTHDGCMMHENRYSTDRDVVVGWAKRAVTSALVDNGSRLFELEKEIAALREQRAALERQHAALATTYPAATKTE